MEQILGQQKNGCMILPKTFTCTPFLGRICRPLPDPWYLDTLDFYE